MNDLIPNLNPADNTKVAVMEVKIDTIVKGNEEIKADIKSLKNQFVSTGQHASDMMSMQKDMNNYVKQSEFVLMRESIQALSRSFKSLMSILGWILGIVTTIGVAITIYYLTHL